MKGCLSRRTGGRESFAGRTAIRQHCPFPPSRSSSALPHCDDCRRPPPLDVGVLARPGNGDAAAVPPLSFAARALALDDHSGGRVRKTMLCRSRGRNDGRRIFPLLGKTEERRAKGAQSGIGLRRGHIIGAFFLLRSKGGEGKISLLFSERCLCSAATHQLHLLFQRPTTGIPGRAQVCRDLARRD